MSCPCTDEEAHYGGEVDRPGDGGERGDDELDTDGDGGYGQAGEDHKEDDQGQ